ncbi:hypothetical protein NC653_041872 [Populus alba x Populus x berolinensis]|uniref:Uncharacterized protein n=1 Tax=Populus alba x Populus x berolinensis TaxID=444605 RepID=A0AAD6L9S3_9ROSI|nr:hypothetical protein NC653_041863 [Populus alba x Populus x berolinensis]KAJ6952858.1 hypothetical protein NC653_041872 [Populus alba x Populus x berolinensis]
MTAYGKELSCRFGALATRTTCSIHSAEPQPLYDPKTTWLNRRDLHPHQSKDLKGFHPQITLYSDPNTKGNEKAFRALSHSKSSSNFISHLCHKINSKLIVQVLMFPLQILLMQFVASTWGNLCYKEAVF